jgi:serine protease Do
MRLSIRIATLAVMLTALGLVWGHPATAAALSPTELLQLAQQSTFEVVVPKVEPEYVRYEKPLPLELLSYRERNDKYWSIGTAFAIAPDTYVSAAHVLLSGLGSPMGQPQLRDSAGQTYAVERIVKFSLHEDYIVFRARGATAARVLQPNPAPAVGGPVYAVGNALGDGVVLRDGLLTSLTPEDQDGRWKWLRFSAAASPGNSGGPLLDAEGRLLGVITAKSPGENLNYALPIARVLDGREAAVFDVRSSFGLPILRQQLVADFKDSFALPAKWDDFARRLMERGDLQYQANERRLLAEHAAQLPPGGNVARLLANLETGIRLGVIRQQDDDSWDISEPEGSQETKLAGGGSLWTGSIQGAYTFQLKRATSEAGDGLYRDNVAFMDMLLKGIKLPRMVGQQAIRITSLGQPQRQELRKDRFDRVWQVRSWSLGYADLVLVTMALATPQGYSGLMRFTPAAGYHDTLAGLWLLADYTHVSYEGNPAQWQTLLANKELCPPFLRGIKVGAGIATSVPLPGLDITVPVSVLALQQESELVVHMHYAAAGKTLRAQPGGVTLSANSDDDDASWVGIWGQPRPAEGAGKELADRWRQLSAREGKFTGQPQHSSDYTTFWTESALGDASRNLLYHVTMSLKEKSLLPRQVGERRDQLLGGLRLQQERQ